MAKELDPKYLEGLTFRTSKAVETKSEDGKKTQHQFIERPLTEADVLSFAERGDSIVIVAADGRKHTVKKRAGAKKLEDPKASLDMNVDQAVEQIAKLTDIAAIKAFVKGDERKGVTAAAEAAIAGLK